MGNIIFITLVEGGDIERTKGMILVENTPIMKLKEEGRERKEIERWW